MLLENIAARTAAPKSADPQVAGAARTADAGNSAATGDVRTVAPVSESETASAFGKDFAERIPADLSAAERAAALASVFTGDVAPFPDKGKEAAQLFLAAKNFFRDSTQD